MSIHSPFEHDGQLDWDLPQMGTGDTVVTRYQWMKLVSSGVAAITLIGIGLYNLFEPETYRSSLKLTLGSVTLLAGAVATFSFILSIFAAKNIKRQK